MTAVKMMFARFFLSWGKANFSGGASGYLPGGNKKPHWKTFTLDNLYLQQEATDNDTVKVFFTRFL